MNSIASAQLPTGYKLFFYAMDTNTTPNLYLCQCMINTSTANGQLTYDVHLTLKITSNTPNTSNMKELTNNFMNLFVNEICPGLLQ